MIDHHTPLRSAYARPVGFEPAEIAPETFLIRQSLAAHDDAQLMYQSSMLIRGSEPIVVDTGPESASDLWLDTVFGLVDPDDVRWIFVSHNDSDHDGNLLPALAACRNATVLTSAGAVARMTSSFDVPAGRMQWVRCGDRITAGDRVLEVIDPPVYDSPITKGLFDHATGVAWEVDTFAAPVPADAPAVFADELPLADWEHAVAALGIASTPWLEGVRPQWFADRLRAMTDLHPTVVASAHGPALRGEMVERAVLQYVRLPGEHPPVGPGHDELTALLASIHG